MTKRLALALVLLAGCADPDAEPTEIATFEEADLSGRIEVRARFVEAGPSGDVILVEHEEIPGEMPAMRMQVALDRADLASGLTTGDKVTLTLLRRASGVGYRVIDIAPLPDATVLDLDGAGADSVFVPSF